MGKKKKKLKRRSRGRRRRAGLRNMLITPTLQISPKVLEILVLGSNHPMKLIMLLLNKVTKYGMLSFNISLEGCLLLLIGLKASMQISKIRGGRLG